MVSWLMMWPDRAKQKLTLFLLEPEAVLLKADKHLFEGSQMALFICSTDQNIIYVAHHRSNPLQDCVHQLLKGGWGR